MEKEFLIQEFSQMFEDKRHYDNRLFSFITIYFALLTISISVASFTYGSLKENMRFIILTLSLIQVLAGIVVVISLYYNRISYVMVCRQINSIRKYSLSNGTGNFFEYNVMPLNYHYPKFFMANSLHFVVTALIFFANAICLGILLYCIFRIISWSILLTVIYFVLQLVIYTYLLKQRDMLINF